MTPPSDLPPAMQQALALARRAAEVEEVPVGAVLLDPQSGEVIAQAYNEVEVRRDPTAHAEMLVIRKASEKLSLKRLVGLDLYVTLEPCPMCAGAISLARIRQLHFGAFDPKSGGVAHGPRVFEQKTCHHRPEVFAGQGETEAAQLLKDFFRQRRKEPRR
ncbi:MAG: nucleoside deaminase [Pseudomonadota bacterium]